MCHQGDDCDSSDEEWDQHIERHARAFLGLNEPIVEIALDDGVGIGRMVRNAFASADNIHMRASTRSYAGTEFPGGSPVHHSRPGVGDTDGVDFSNVRPEVGDTVASPQAHMFRMPSDTEMQSCDTPEAHSNMSESSDSQTQRTCAPADGIANGFSSAEDRGEASSDNEDLPDAAEDYTNDDDGEGSNDSTSEGEDLEDLMGQVPTDRMGSNPEIDIAATLPLYEGATLSMLCATLLIVNCCKTHGVSNTFLNELLMLLSMSILPRGNCLPKTEYEASKILRRLGLAYNMIHACPKGCCLFRGDLEDAEQCPVCDADRYRMCGRSRVPALVLRHFPLIPQLQRMFSSKKLSKLNVWHHFNKSVDGKMRHTADSPQWNFVHTELEPEAGDDMFGRDPRHIHLGLAVDGMNPYSEKRSTLSLTPVIMFNYNLPPWMVTKKYFVMLCLLIPTKLSLTGSNFDVFIQPLVDELQQLWSRRGVLTRDAREYMGTTQFNMRAVLMWTLHDFPAYGLISGLTTKGFKACPVCGPHTVSRRSKILRKNVYCNCHRRYLPHDHHYRGAHAAFDGVPCEEMEEAPLTGNQTIRRGYQSDAYIDGGGTEKDAEFPGKEHGVKRVSALYQLPYWRVSPLQLQSMHMLISSTFAEHGPSKSTQGVPFALTSSIM